MVWSKTTRALTAALCGVVFLLSLIAAMFPWSARVQAEPVLITQINFDDGSTQGVYPTGGSSSELRDDIAHSAPYSMRIFNRTETWMAAEWDMGARLRRGCTFRFSAWVYHEEAAAVTFQYSLKINDGDSYEYCAQQTVEPRTWTQISGEYTISREQTNVEPYVEMIDSLGAFFIDDISIEMTNGELPDSSIEADLPALKDAPGFDGMQIGASVGATVMSDVSGNQLALLKKHFNALSMENQLKAQYVLDYATSVSDLARYNEAAAINFDAAKPFFEFAKENGMKMSAQALVWFSMTPDWFFYEDYDTTKARASKELMLKRMENYIHDVIDWCETNYPGMIESWVVVNEAIDGDVTPKVRDDLWKQTMGEEYIARAFEYAYAAREENNADFQLLYNDYNIEYYREKMEYVLAYLEDNDCIENGWVDGIGFQMHDKMDWPGVSYIKENMERVKAKGLSIWVTELDIALSDTQITQNYGGSQYMAFRAQKLRYQEIVETLLAVKAEGGDVRGLSFWGLTDAYTWLIGQYPNDGQQYPMLFDQYNKAKPAYYGIMEAAGASVMENLALDRTYSASGSQSGGGNDAKTPERAFDGDRTGTRWASQTEAEDASATAPYWLQIDFGEPVEFNTVRLYWEVCFGKDFYIQVTNTPEDESSWTNVTEQLDGLRGVQEILIPGGVTAQYVRMYAMDKDTEWGCSLYEFEVYNDTTMPEDPYAPPADDYWDGNGGEEETSSETSSEDASSEQVASETTSSDDTASTQPGTSSDGTASNVESQEPVPGTGVGSVMPVVLIVIACVSLGAMIVTLRRTVE